MITNRKKAWSKLAGMILPIMMFLAITCPVSSKAAEKPHISVTYFYMNPCGSCDEKSKFMEKYNRIVGELDDEMEVEFGLYNTFHARDAEIMESYLKKYKVPQEKRQVPLLFINETCLSGTEEIDTRLKAELSKAGQPDGNSDGTGGSDSGIQASGKSNESYQVRKNNSNDSVLVYFYLPSCEDCNKVNQVLQSLNHRYTFSQDNSEVDSRLILKKFNAGETGNLLLLKDYFSYYQVPDKDQRVPIVFIGDTWLSGPDAVQSDLKQAILKEKGLDMVELYTGSSKADVQSDSLSGYGLLGVLATGLINGVNPCSLSIVLFFLSLLAVKNVSLLRAGIVFILGKFITFFLLGTLLYRLFLQANISWFQSAAKIAAVVIALLFVFLNIRDMIAARNEQYNEIKLQLPIRLRKLNHRLVKIITGINSEKVFLPLSLLLGMVIAAGEFLCTGQIYLATIVMVLQNNPVFEGKATIYFMIYGLAFIFPLILLTFLVHKGKEVFELSEAVRAKMPLIKLINAIVFMAFAVAAVIWF